MNNMNYYYGNADEFLYGNASVGQYNPDTNTVDYDPKNLPDDEVGFRTVGVARIGVELRLPTGDVVIVNPDDYITDMVVELPDHTVETIKGRLATVCGSSRYQRFMPRFYNPRGPQLSDYIFPQMLVIDSSEAHRSQLHYIPIMSILSVGEVQTADTLGVIVVGPGAQYAPLDQVINNAEPDSVIELLSGDYEMDLNIQKNLTIKAKGIAKLHGHITIGTEGSTESLEVVLQGLDLMDQAMIEVNHATSFTMDNCVIGDLQPDVKTMPIAFKESNKCFISICNNTFKKNNKYCYNLIDVYPYITENSKINNNRFEEDCCTHNTISLYGLDKDGDVEINGNYCAVSKNMVRIGFRGIVNGRIAIEKNIYDETDTDAQYAGLVIVQPYNKDTVDMNMLDISVSDTVNNSGNPQLIYMYSGPKDLKFNDANKPKIYVDGYYTDVPYIEVWPEDESNNNEDPNYAPLANFDENNPPEPGTVVFDDDGSEFNLDP